MEIKINLPKDNIHIKNLAFVRALLIRDAIEGLNVSYQEKEKLKNEILEYLRKTWKILYTELKSHTKKGVWHEKEN